MHGRARVRQRIGAAIDDHELMLGRARHSAPQEATIVRLVIDDVSETLRRILPVAPLGVEQGAFGRDPENEIRIAMSELAKRRPTPACAGREEWEAFGCPFARD